MTNTSKTIDTLVNDIYDLFTSEEGVKVDQEALSAFSTNVAKQICVALETRRNRDAAPMLRMSKLGTPDRKLWYEFNASGEGRAIEEFKPKDLIKFLYGNILEELLLFLAKQSGHDVTGEQGELTVLGVPGHRDAKIDGVTVDVKSASSFSFSKFLNGTLFTNDPFGYISQISSYVFADNMERKTKDLPPIDKGAFLAINKESGELALLVVDVIDMIDPVQRITHIKNKVLNSPVPPAEKCYPTEPYGKAGNEVLNKNCHYCKHVKECWLNDGLKAFKYSDGVKYFSKVVKVPEVDEIIL